jgi:subfamily B ATP-binding cassette protein MsbA
MRFYLRILSYFRTDRRLLVALFVLITVALGLAALQALPAGILVDVVATTSRKDDWHHRLFLSLFPQSKLAQIIGLAAATMLLKIAQETVWLLRTMINHRLRYNGTARVRAELFDHLQALGPGYHRSRSQGDSIYRLGTDTTGFFGVLDTFVGAAFSCASLLVIARMMLSFNRVITLIALSVIPLLLVVNWYFSRSIRRTSTVSKQVDSDLTTVTQRSIAALFFTKLFSRERDESNRFRGIIAHSVSAGMRMNWQEQLYPLVVQCIFAVGAAAVIAYGGYLVYRDQLNHVPGGFSMGDVTACTLFLAQLWDPVMRITGFTAAVQTNATACRRVFDVLDHPVDVTEDPAAPAVPLRPRTLALNGVCFGYCENSSVLNDVSVRIAPGQMVAFIGPSGAGKSTLLHLLPRLYDPTGGSLSLDEHDLRTLRLADVRRHIAVVPQDCSLLAGTIAENIAYGRPSADMRDIQAIAELAGCAEFIESLPSGYDTLVAEGGQNFSGGQRQRIAIARALLTDAPILVLDEPTSALDPRHEQKVIDMLRRLKGRRTVILVTHRVESVRECDQIFVLSAGRVVERGTHEQLLCQRGHYFAMARPPMRDGVPSISAA